MWNVYALVDPRSETIFYIGISINPNGRLLNHLGDPASAAYPRCREIRAAGHKPQQHVLAECTDKFDALLIERALVLAHPGLVNRQRVVVFPAELQRFGVAGDVLFHIDDPNQQ